MMNNVAFSVFVLCLFQSALLADSWPPPRASQATSPGNKFMVRLIPGHIAPSGHRALLFRLSGSGKARLVKRFVLKSGFSHHFIVSDSGALFTFDNWGRMGFGKVIAVYNSKGRLIKSYQLKQLLGIKQLQTLKHKHSGLGWIVWRQGLPFVACDKVVVPVVFGGDLTFLIKNGERSLEARCDTNDPSHPSRPSADKQYTPFTTQFMEL